MDTKKLMLLTFLILLSLLPFCLSLDTLTINQSITDSKFLLSKDGTFALGFFSPGNSRYKYLGIWYHKLPGPPTVVWVANRDNPINSSSGILSMNPDGNLVLYSNYDQKSPFWSTNVSLNARGVYVAQLFDSGNLVLFENESKRNIWQSFDYPTDTMLPGMKLGLDRRNGLDRYLTSWRSVDDPGTGNYTFRINPSGSPQVFLYKGLTKYWRSKPWPWPQAQTPPNHDFVNTQYEIYYTYVVPDESIITRTVVHRSGLFQLLTWENHSQQWKETWSDPTNTNIYGHCGAYSICNGNNVYIFECTCLPGHEPRSLKNWNRRDGSDGCVSVTPQLRKRRQTKSMCRNGDGFVKVAPVKLPDTSISALMNTSMRSRECEQLCRSNCSCRAFASLEVEREGAVCLTWYGELMDTAEYTGGPELYVRVNAIELAEHEKKTTGFLKQKGMFAIPVSSVALTMFLILILAYLYQRKKREPKVKKQWTKRLFATLVANDLVGSRQPPDLEFFDLETIFAATNNFSPSKKLGQGGFGSVYEGQLPDGQEIAVKRLSRSSGQGIEEFKNEVMLIARLQHKNLVKLLGCCIQGEEQMLIYEYLPNKSLDSFIFDARRRSLLDWSKRFDIIVGIACGLLYLHHDSRLRIIHRDLKTSNVLLDAEMKPKISDFGMARIFRGDQVQDKTNRIVGTYGYMAPEYAALGKFSLKSDVFSFGVILLEIISGKKSNTSYEKDPSLSLTGHVWDLWKEDRVLDIVDSSLTESYLASDVFRCIQIGLLCVQENVMDRPTMSTVVLMLNGETALPRPKQPAFVFKKSSNDPSPSGSGGGPCSLNEMTITIVEAR